MQGMAGLPLTLAAVVGLPGAVGVLPPRPGRSGPQGWNGAR